MTGRSAFRRILRQVALTFGCVAGPAHAWAQPPCSTVTCLTERASTAGVEIQSAKNSFAASLLRFAQAVQGPVGDEGRDAMTALDATANALTAWDGAIERYDGALRGLKRSVDTLLARAAVYLDRSRHTDALGLLDEAARLDAARPEVWLLHAMAYERVGRVSEAARALEAAAALPRAPITVSYLLASARARLGEGRTAGDALRAFRNAHERAAEGSGGPPGQLFPRMGLFRPAADVAPLFLPAAYAKGAALVERGDFAAAVTSFREAAARDPLIARGEDRLLDEALQAVRRGELRRALESLRATVHAEPSTAERRRVLASLYRADDQLDGAIDELRIATGLAPGDERSRLALAEALQSAGRTEQVEREWQDMAHALPDSAHAHYRLGQLHQALGRYADAADEFERAERLGPLLGRDQLLELVAQLHLQEADVEGAVVALRARVAHDPNGADAHRALGDAYARLARTDDALGEYAAALLLSPRDARVHAARAQAYLQAGDYPQAERSARRAVDVDPSQIAARFALAMSIVRQGRTSEGAAEMEVFRRLQADEQARERRALDVRLLQQSAWADAERGDYEAALRAIRTTVDLDPRSPDARLSLGVILKRAGRQREALQELRTARDLGAGPDVLRHLVEVHRALGDAAAAAAAEESYDQAKAARLRSRRP